MTEAIILRKHRYEALKALTVLSCPSPDAERPYMCPEKQPCGARQHGTVLFTQQFPHPSALRDSV